MQADANEFLLTENAAVLTKTDELIKEMTGIVEQAKGLARTEEETKEIAEVGEKIAAFHEEFRRVGELTKEQSALVDQVIGPDGEKLAADTEQLTKMSAKEGNANALIIARTAELAFARGQGALATGLGLDKEEAMATFEKPFDELEQAITGLDKATQGTDMHPIYEEVAALAKEYHEAAEKAVEDHKELQELIEKEMAKTGDEADAILGRLHETISKEEEALHNDLSSTIITTEITIVVVAIVGFALGVVISLLIASGIAKPVIMDDGCHEGAGRRQPDHRHSRRRQSRRNRRNGEVGPGLQGEA